MLETDVTNEIKVDQSCFYYKEIERAKVQWNKLKISIPIEGSVRSDPTSVNMLYLS